MLKTGVRVHVLGMTVVRGAGCTGPGGYQGRVYRWVPGRAIPGTTHPPTALLRGAHPDSGAGPGSPAGAGVGGQGGRGLQGLGTAAGTAISPPSGPGQALQAFPGICPQNAALQPKGRDLTSFPIKLVKTAKCRRNMSIRPVIVPISKTGSRSHLLNFLDFHFRQPSLTRN